MIVLDASVLIAHLDGGDSWHERATALLRGALDQALVANVLTVGEVLVGPARADRLAVATAALDRLGVTPVELSAQAGPALAEIRTSTRLRMPDSGVLLTAESDAPSWPRSTTTLRRRHATGGSWSRRARPPTRPERRHGRPWVEAPEAPARRTV